MQVKFNPKDSNTFASCSLDNSIKVWGINSSTPYFSLTEHKMGVNCIDYAIAGDKPYLISGSDDKVEYFLYILIIDCSYMGLSNKNLYSNIRRSY